MHTYIPRAITDNILHQLATTPAVAMLGPRQCGKIILAKNIIGNMDNSACLDPERRGDLKKLRDPEAFFNLNISGLICLDGIQRIPDLIAEMGSRVDRQRGNGQLRRWE